ncbi:hypothetical protein [Thetidibacter halocola]|uniref:Uncharacterized protein n=1 Tax=Thetidibacter halocola TaxID=2827239 RepID=A0A8J7WI57_9RHOB|nr:hypothetical protein [Thetidibacter halocola]MBS0126869.1 hypothetical protein [Thetidibacter halocola]
MFWSKKKPQGNDRQPRREPPLTSKSTVRDTEEQSSPENVSNNIRGYADLLEVSPTADPAGYRRHHGNQGVKNSAGIPLAFEDQAQTVARIIASAYEEKYDQIKAEMKSRGMQFSAVILDDAGTALAVNFASVGAAPIVSQISDEPELVPYCIAALHWLLASEDHEWVFSHLVEATAAFYRSEMLRTQLVKGYADDFDDLRDLLREALCHYIHRNV